MMTISLDVHAELSQLSVVAEHGEVLLEMQVPTKAEDLRRVVSGVPGRKRVVMEHGPMSGLIHEALEGLADEIVSADPARNALIARSEDSNDERDARRLGVLDRAGALHKVYVPEEPYRTFRSLVRYDRVLQRSTSATMVRMKALCRRFAVECRGKAIYRGPTRKEFVCQLPNASLKWQLQSLGRRLDAFRTERVRGRRLIGRLARKIPAVAKLKTIPGVGDIVATTLVAWIVDPTRFKNRSAVGSYGGLGLGQGITNWKKVGRARASKRGNRELKRVLFIAAEAALRGNSALRRRYDVRMAAGWETRKAERDIARTILWTACAIMRTGRIYDDGQVSVPELPGDRS